MKNGKWLNVIQVLVIVAMVVVGFAIVGCIDPDEALPHYHMSNPESPN